MLQTQKISYPAFNILDYDSSLLKNLQFYSLEVQDDKLKKSWALKYWESNGLSTKEISKLNESYFSTVGAVVHLATTRGVHLDDKHKDYVIKKYNELLLLATQKDQEQDKDDQSVVVRTKDELVNDMLSANIAEFEYMLDLFIASLKKSSEVKFPDVKGYLIRNNIKPGISRKIATWFKSHLKDAKLAYEGADEQSIESYSYLSRRQLKKYIECVQSMIDSCEVASAIQKEARKPREKKQIPVSQIVKDVKYLEEDKSSNLKSDHPSKIVGSTEVWLYCPSIRRLFKCVSIQGMKLTISGTTIKNLDQEKSGGKIIRKPEVQLAGIQQSHKSVINKIYDDIRGTISRSTGRMNGDTIIVKVF